MKTTKFLSLLIPTSVIFLTPNFVISHSYKNNLNQTNSKENVLSDSSSIFKQSSIDLTEAKFNDWNYINNISQEYNDDWSKRVYDVAISSVGSSNLFNYQNTYNGDINDSLSSIGVPSNPKETIFSLLLDSIDWEQIFPGDIESKNLSQKNCYFVITDAPILGINGGFLLNYKLYLRQVEKIKDDEGRVNTVISQNKEVLIKSNTLSLKGFKPYTKDIPKWNNDIQNISNPKSFTINNSPKKGMELTQIIGIAMCLGGGVLLLVAMIILLVKKSKIKEEEDIRFNAITKVVPSEYTNYIVLPNTQIIEQYQQNPYHPQLENFYQTEEEQYDNSEITEEIKYDFED